LIAAGMKKRRVEHLIASILVFWGLVAGMVFLARPLQKDLFAKMTVLRDDFISQGEAFLGMKIEYASMGPSLFSTLDIRGIRIYGSASEPLVSLARLRVSYSLLGVMRGQGAGAFRSILLDKPVVSFDVNHAKDWEVLSSRIRGQGEGVPGGTQESSGDWLARIPGAITVKIRGGEGKLLVGENRFSLSGLNLDTVIRENIILVKGKLEGDVFLEDFFDQPMTVVMRNRFSGELDTRLRGGKLVWAIPSLSGDRFSLRTIQFDVALENEKIVVQKIGDMFPFDLSLGYAFDTRRFFGRFDAREFTPGFFLSLLGPWEGYNPFLGLSLTGSASFETGGQGGASSYSLDISGNLGDVSPIPDVSYALSLSGNDTYVHFRRLALDFPQGNIQYTGNIDFKTLAPNGTISISDLGLGPDSGDGNSTGYLLNANLKMNSYGRTIAVSGESISLGPVLFTALDTRIIREDRGLTFDLSALQSVGTEPSGNGGTNQVSIEGSFDYEPRHLQASLMLDAFPLGDLLRIFQTAAIVPMLPESVFLIAGGAFVTTEVFITTDFDQILYNTPHFQLVYQGQYDFNIQASVSGTDRRFELNQSRIVAAGNEAEVSGYLDFYNPNDVIFSLIGSYRNMSYYLEGAVLDKQSLSIQGSYGFLAYIDRMPFGGYSGYVEAESIPIPWREDQFFRLNFLSLVRYDSPESWFVDLSRLTINELATPASSSASLQFSGKADQDGLMFRDVLFDDSREKLRGQAAVSWNREIGTEPETAISWVQSQVQAARIRPAWSRITFYLNLRDEGNWETYNLEGFYENDIVDVRLTGREMQLDRFLTAARNTLATGEARLHWIIGEAYELTMDLPSLTTRYNENIITLSAQASLVKEELVIRNFRVNYENIEAELPFFRMNRRETEVWTQGQFRGIAVGRRIDGSFTVEMNFQPIGSWIALRKVLDSFSGAVVVDRIRLDTLELSEPFRFNFSRNESLISFSGGPRNMIRFRITNDGSFYAGLSYPFPIRGSVTGTITSRTIDAQSSDLYIDLTALGRFLPQKEIVTLSGGFVNASVEIRGPLGDPEFFGTAWGNSVRLQLPQYLGTELGPVPITVALEGNEMNFGPVNVPAGKGSGIVSGWFRFDRWVPDTFSIDIRSSREYPVPFDFELLGIMVKGGASGVMNVSRIDSQLRLSGDLVGEDTEIILDMQGISAAMDQSFVNTTGIIADFILTTGRKVEFFWPTADYPLLQAAASAGTKMKITSDTETGRFSIIGDVALQSGSLYYGQRSFYIREGTLFFNENEIQFEPRISIRAETRDRTDDGPVTISLIVDNGFLKSFSPRFEASPALSQVEILSLLGQNLTGLSVDGRDGAQVQNIVFSGVDFLSQSIVFRRVERLIRNFIGLDMLSLRAPIVQNFITSRWTPIDNQARGNYFDNTVVYFGKYFTSDMFFQGSVLMQYDENKLDMGGYTFDADLGIELHSPLFDIRWNISPLKYETFFDASFTLSWRWLF
jgi:hypothetical protein